MMTYYQVQIEKYCNDFENVAYSSRWHFDSLCHINSYNYTFCQLISRILTSSTNFLKIFPEQFISFWFNKIWNSAKVIYLWKSDRGHTRIWHWGLALSGEETEREKKSIDEHNSRMAWAHSWHQRLAHTYFLHFDPQKNEPPWEYPS